MEPINCFKRFFKHKGNIAPIAEKAFKNFELKKYNTYSQNKLHYFAVGHTFKNIDKEKLFEIDFCEDTKSKTPNKFINLQQEKFTFSKYLSALISDIRNLNSHFIHDFEKIKIENINCELIDFIKEAFELAVIQIILKEKKCNYEEYISKYNPDKEIVEFLAEKFYPFDENKKNKYRQDYNLFREQFKQKNKQDAINTILFIKVNEIIDWKLYDEHFVFNISKGEYLSFEACLFILSMFLFKGEANSLISRITGFKNNNTEYNGKREIFTFYSKKFSSQDVDSEEDNLVKFRDIIQYLNHYPTSWNDEMALESKFPKMTNQLKEKIIEMEINRQYLENTDKQWDDEKQKRFITYVKYYIWGKKYLGKKVENEYKALAFNSWELDCDFKEELYNEDNQYNEKTENLKRRIAKNMLFVSYGRNQDRFMFFAARYLAENNYFGKDAKFKMYRYYYPDEQNEALDLFNSTLDKKKYDKLKFHRGKLVYFSTFARHKKKFPLWANPYVIENNAIQICITFSNGDRKIVSIQRNLMKYFLENALYNNEGDIEDKGKELLEGYYKKHSDDFSRSYDVLKQNDSISEIEKNEFKKILPRRLLNNYLVANRDNSREEFNGLELILKRAEIAEDRYRKLLDKVKQDENKIKNNYPNDEQINLVADFSKKNKGKRFKLQFIRKACNIMFFRDIYIQNSQTSGHHKRFHIHRDEFNDFSKWMYAYDDTTGYKDNLKILFENKGFFDNITFKSIFEESNSIDVLYNKTKNLYKDWLENNIIKRTPAAEGKYTLKGYENILKDKMFYINVPHFISYMEQNEKLQRDKNKNLTYKSLENVEYLIPEYYYKERLDKSEYKSCGKFYNKLKSIKLEDCLLFEIAIKYLNINEFIKNKITKILEQNIDYIINDKNNKPLFTLRIPFKKIDNYVELITNKKNEEIERDTSFIEKIPIYIENYKKKEDEDNKHKDKKDKGRKDSDVKEIYNKYESKKILDYFDLYKFNNHIINNSINFTQIILAMEEYYIHKGKININECNRIKINEISELTSLNNAIKKYREKAFHFGIPDKSYLELIKQIEEKFLKNEINKNYTSFNDLEKPLKFVCQNFLDIIHNDYFSSKNDKKIEIANEKYFNNNLKKYIKS